MRSIATVSVVPVGLFLGLFTGTVAAQAATIGTYQPGVTNTGIPAGVTLTRHNGDITVTTPNTVLSGLDVHGFVKVRAANVTIKNSRIWGSNTATASTGLVDAASPAVKNLLIQNCDLVAAFPSIWLDGVIGHDYKVFRSNVHRVVDGFGVFNPNSPATDLNVDIEGNWVHGMSYMSPDPTHSNGHTHNDAIQIQGTGSTHGKVQVRIFGNSLQDFAGVYSNSHSPSFPAAPGSAIAVTPNVSRIHDVVISHNWLGGGDFAIQMIPGSKGTGGGISVTRNIFGRNSVYPGIRIQAPVTISAANNFYGDGAPVPIVH